MFVKSCHADSVCRHVDTVRHYPSKPKTGKPDTHLSTLSAKSKKRHTWDTMPQSHTGLIGLQRVECDDVNGLTVDCSSHDEFSSKYKTCTDNWVGTQNTKNNLPSASLCAASFDPSFAQDLKRNAQAQRHLQSGSHLMGTCKTRLNFDSYDGVSVQSTMNSQDIKPMVLYDTHDSIKSITSFECGHVPPQNQTTTDNSMLDQTQCIRFDEKYFTLRCNDNHVLETKDIEEPLQNENVESKSQSLFT